MNHLFLIPLGLLGLCVGSFCNVLIYRLPKGEDFVRTPSHCMYCGHPLRWYELIPLVSWLIQGGKCRSCGHKLSVQYPLVEALNGALWLLAGVLFAVLIYELVGPALTKRSLLAVGEIRPEGRVSARKHNEPKIR